MTKGSDNNKRLVDTFTRGYPYTHTLVHVQPTEAAAIVKSSEQPHTGPYLWSLLIHSVLERITEEGLHHRHRCRSVYSVLALSRCCRFTNGLACAHAEGSVRLSEDTVCDFRDNKTQTM